jgi:hypothetical protein
MIRMCVYLHSRFIKNHLIRIREDGTLISEGVLSHCVCTIYCIHYTVFFVPNHITNISL